MVALDTSPLVRPDRAPEAPITAVPWLLPALLAGFEDLAPIRHAFPLALLPDPEPRLMASLASLLDEAIAADAAAPVTGGAENGSSGGGTPDPALRETAYRVETELKRRLADARDGRHPARSLGDAWRAASATVVSALRDPARRTRDAAFLDRMASRLPGGAQLLACDAEAPATILAHAWRRHRAGQAGREAAALSDLIGRVGDLLEAEAASSPAAASADRLAATMTGEHAGGIDFGALASLLATSPRYRDPTPERTVRLRRCLAVLTSARDTLHDLEPTAATTGAAALARWRREIAARLEVARAERVATLELHNRYRADRHDALFAALDEDELTPDEQRALPPVLAILDGDSVDAGEQALLLEILAAQAPLKIVLIIHALPGAPTAGQRDGWTMWPLHIASMATALGGAYVVQASVSELPNLGAAIAAGIAHPGPALFAIHAPADEPGADGPGLLPAFIRAAAAVEGRIFPTFAFDPAGGRVGWQRLSLAGNPQPDRRWPEHELRYEDRDGHAISERVAFTAADYLAMDARFAGQFTSSGEARRDAPDAVPAGILVVDAAGRLTTIAVAAHVRARAEHIAERWEDLRAAAERPPEPLPDVVVAPPSTGAEVADLSLAAMTAAGIADDPAAREAAVVAPSAAAAPASTPPLPTAAPPAPAGAADGPAGGAAWIESAFCTACNECTQRNGRMFAYNDARQAFIRDPGAGSFRDLVEAAENCPVCIIHPGAPLDPSESGLDDLVARAAAFA